MFSIVAGNTGWIVTLSPSSLKSAPHPPSRTDELAGGISIQPGFVRPEWPDLARFVDGIGRVGRVGRVSARLRSRLARRSDRQVSSLAAKTRQSLLSGGRHVARSHFLRCV